MSYFHDGGKIRFAFSCHPSPRAEDLLHALEWDERQAIKGKPLAQWLQSYYSTHAAPFPVSIGFLHEKCGSPTKLLKHFKTELRNAFETLETTLSWTVTWERNLVTVVRTPSAAQHRHITKKMARTKRLKEAKEAQELQREQHSNGRPAQQNDTGMFSTRQRLNQLMKAR